MIKQIIYLVFLLLAFGCRTKKPQWNEESRTFLVSNEKGQVLLHNCKVLLVLNDSSVISSNDFRFRPTFQSNKGQSTIFFNDVDNEVDFALSYIWYDSLSFQVELEVLNTSDSTILIDKIYSIQGQIAYTDYPDSTLVLVTSENWENDKIVYTLDKSKPVNSMFTVAMNYPSVAAGFLKGKMHFNHFTVSEKGTAISLAAWGEGNGCAVRSGKTRKTDPLFISFHDNPLQQMERFAALAGKQNNAKLWPENRAVWCTWYAGWNREKMYSYRDGIAKGIEDNIPFIKNEFLSRGANTMRICDDHIAYGDWHDTTKAFPEGLSQTAKRINEAGLTPGVWYPVFWASTGSEVYQQHPDWFAMEEDRSPYLLKNEFQNRSRLEEPHKFMVFDASVPEVQDYFEQTAKTWRERGFKYVTNDFLAYATAPPRYINPEFSKAQVLRAGLEAVKRGLGDDVFYRTIGGQFGTCMGLSHDVRISGDSHGNRPFAYQRTGAAWFYNHRVWINDPSAIVFMRYGEFRDVEWNKMWVSWIALAGTVMTYGEQLDLLPEEYINIYKRVFPPLKVAGRPLDIWENQPFVLWGMQPDKEDDSYCLFGVFDLDGKGKRQVKLNLDEVMSRAQGWKEYKAAPEKYLLWDFWNRELIHSKENELDIPMPEKSCRLFALRKYLGVPQLLGTDGHFSMGALETKDIVWDENTATISGMAKGNGGNAVTLYFYVPESFTIKNIVVDGQKSSYNQVENIFEIKIPPSESMMAIVMEFDGVKQPLKQRAFLKGNPAQRYSD